MKKLKHYAKKLIEGLLIILCIITFNFFLVRFMPGDVVEHIIGAEEYYTLANTAPEVIEAVKADYGLDKGLFEQYMTYLDKTVHLDFGTSYRTKMPVLQTVSFRCRWTLCLSVPTLIIAGILGAVSGLYCGWKKGGIADNVMTNFFLIINTIPTNCLAIIFLIVFAFKLRMFPIGGITSGGLHGFAKTLDILRHIQLPLIVMVLYRVASDHMLMRSTVSQIKNEPYIETAVSKGMRNSRVVFVHLLKNALCPYITSLCMQFGNILAGSMMIEIVFSWKGMGTLIYDSVNTKDFPMLQACFLFIGISVVLANFLSDFICRNIDPRIKEGFINEA